MKTVIDGFEIEGTPSEIDALLSLNKNVKSDSEVAKILDEEWKRIAAKNRVTMQYKPLYTPRKKKRKTASKVRYPHKSQPYTTRDDITIERAYTQKHKRPGFLKALSKELGRTKAAISERARYLQVATPRQKRKANFINPRS